MAMKGESSEWATNEDFLDDLWSYSEYTEPSKSPPPEPKTVTEWKNMNFQNNTPSIFDREIPDDFEHYVSGRGRGQPHRLVQPGNFIQSLPSDSEDITRRIREVGGLYFRNDIVEQSIQSHQALLRSSNNIKSEDFRDASEDESLVVKFKDLSASTSGVSGNSSPTSKISSSSSKQSSSPRSDRNSASGRSAEIYDSKNVNSSDNSTRTSPEVFDIRGRPRKTSRTVLQFGVTNNNNNNKSDTSDSVSSSGSMNSSRNSPEPAGERSPTKASVMPWRSKRVQEKKLLLDIKSRSDFPPLSKPYK